MDTVTEKNGEQITVEERIEFMVNVLGYSPENAKFITSIEDGLISGDVVIVGNDDKPAKADNGKHHDSRR